MITLTHTVEQLAGGSPGGGLRERLREYYQSLLSRLGWPGSRSARALRTLGLTSCSSGEGVSTVASQLAATAATYGDRQVLLVDCNLSRPSVQQTFEVDLSPGLAEVLRNDRQLADAVQSSPVANLSVITAGDLDGAVAKAYDSAGLFEVVAALEREFELVVFDMPAAGQASSAISLAGLLDGVLLVVEAERVRWEVAQRAQEVLTRAGARLLGAVLNKRRQHVPDWLYRTL